MSITKISIPLFLSDQVDFERQLAENYQKAPRSRRQEYLRTVLRAGIDSLNNSASYPPIAAAPFEAVAPKKAQANQTPSGKAEKKHSKDSIAATGAKSAELKGFFHGSKTEI